MDRWIRISDFKLRDNSLCNKILSSIVCILSSVLCRLPLYICRESSTNRPYFMQNKANLLAIFKMPTMNITSSTTVNYINELRTMNYKLIMKNKPKQSQFSDERNLPWACRRGLPWAQSWVCRRAQSKGPALSPKLGRLAGQGNRLWMPGRYIRELNNQTESSASSAFSAVRNTW